QSGRQGQRGQAGQQGGPGQQPGSGQAGGQAGQSGALGGQQAGGATSGGFSAINRGDWQPAPGGAPPMTPEQIARTYGETIRDLRRLQSSLQGQPEITRDVQDLIRE